MKKYTRIRHFALLTFVVAGLFVHSAPAAQLRGLWEFQESAQPGKATVGADLVFSGSAPSWSGTVMDDAALAQSGVITTVRGATNRILAAHGIPANGGGTRVNQVSFVMDIFSPTASRNQWRTIFQTDVNNASDADYFIRTDSLVGVGALGYSASPINQAGWTRLVITIDLAAAGNDVKAYVNGAPFYTHSPDQGVDGRFSLAPGAAGVLMFTDEDGENYPLHVAGLAIYEGALTAQEVALLGGPGKPMTLPEVGKPPVVLAQPAGPSNIVALAEQVFTFRATDPEGADVQIQADWGDGRLSAWTALGASGQTRSITNSYSQAGAFLIRARARDAAGMTSDWATVQTITVSPGPGRADGLVGLWEFDDAQNPGKATYGTALAIVGTAPGYAASRADGQATPQTLEGVILTAGGVGNHLRATHGIGANGNGTRVNVYTLLFDVLVPAEGAWRAFYQTSLANDNDADYFVRNSDGALGRAVISYSGLPIQANRWRRLALSVDLTASGSMRAYLDGELFHVHTRPPADGEYSLDPAQVLLFADNDNENGPLAIGMAAMFSKALTAAEVAALGGPGLAVVARTNNQLPTLANQVAGPVHTGTGKMESFVFYPGDADGDRVQVQADWGDGSAQSWSSLTAAGSPQTLAHTWTFPGQFTLRARARDVNGAFSDWVTLQSITVTGAVQVAFATSPYQQNISTSNAVIMAELEQNVPLVLRYGTTTTYDKSVAMETVASGGGTWFTRGVITGLKADTTYHYCLASTSGEPATPDATFRTATTEWVDFTFGAVGDTQTDNQVRTSGAWAWQADPWEPAKTMLHDMLQRGVAFGLGIGDHAQDGNSYSSTRDSHLERWATILGPHVPFYIAWGNHDGSSPQHPLRLSADMPSRWRTDSSPSIRTPGFGNYTFTYGGVFFVCLEYFEMRSAADPANDITNGWLDEQLASAAARDARFRIVAVHVPPFCERWIDGSAALRAQLVPRLEKYDVQICFSGHMHGYERGFLNDVNYVTIGTGSYLDIGERLVYDWPHIFLGGYDNVPGLYAMQSSFGVLGTPQPIQGGLFHGYAQVSIRDRFLLLEVRGFNADGSYIGVLDSFQVGVDPGPDTDGDGMRDAWETEHHFKVMDAADAGLDADSDGMSNLQEFIAGTDPHDRNSRMQILSFERGGSTANVRWSSVAGKNYRLAWSDDLASWAYAKTAGSGLLTIPAAPGSSTEAIVQLPASAEPLFVRLEVVR